MREGCETKFFNTPKKPIKVKFLSDGNAYTYIEPTGNATGGRSAAGLKASRSGSQCLSLGEGANLVLAVVLRLVFDTVAPPF